MWFENINSHVNCNWDLTVCWNVACWKMPQSALGLCVELLCNQQFSIIGGQCQCQNKAPTAPNRSKLSLQMSLRCQLKSFSWNRDDGALTTAELMCRPEEERLNTSARDKQTEIVTRRNSTTPLTENAYHTLHSRHMLISSWHFLVEQQWGLMCVYNKKHSGSNFGLMPTFKISS